MRLQTLRLQNFRGYKDEYFRLHPQFNLIVGENGSGKTSFLEAASVAIGSWFLGIRGYDSRSIRSRDVRVERELIEKRYRELLQYPVRVSATGIVNIATAKRNDDTGTVEIVGDVKDRDVIWSRSLEGPNGRTTQQDAKPIKVIAESMANAVYKREPRILPLIRYFGAGRLWESVRESEKKSYTKKKKQPLDLAADADELEKSFSEFEKLSEPFYGYHFSVDKRCNPEDIIRWMAYERRNEIDDEQDSIALRLVYIAIQRMLPNTLEVRYNLKQKTLIIHLADGRALSFQELSDGYRNILAMAADLAIKAVMLNPQLAERALELTPGVVLIDELDLHLHPSWQRNVIEAFRTTFPLLQFICTTHSPFLIQSLRSGEELVVLDGQPTSSVANLTIEEIAEGLMQVPHTEVSSRYAEMKAVARNYLETLEEAAIAPSEKLEAYKNRLSEAIGPYSENPAYQALLEMKRVAKLGE
jgi:predicted ATP-binding protein involved in virulence